MVHRNTYINGPTVLRETWQTQGARRSVLRRADLRRRRLRRVGGVGPAGRASTRRRWPWARRRAAAPRTTAIGALAYYVSHAVGGPLPAEQHHLRHHGAAGRRGAAAEASRAEDARSRSARWRDLDARLDGASPCSSSAMQRHERTSLTGLPRVPAPQPRRVAAHGRAPTTATSTQFLAFLAAAHREAPRRAAAGRLRRRARSASFLAELYRRGTLAQDRRAQAGGGPGVRAATCGARALIDGDPGALVGHAESASSKLPAHLEIDEMAPAARDAGPRDAARPARPGDARAVLRVGAAPERAGRPRPRRREPRRRGWCACSARAARSASCRSTRSAERALRAYLKDRPRARARGAAPAPGPAEAAARRGRPPARAAAIGRLEAAVPQLPRRAADRAAASHRLVRQLRRAVQRAVRHQPARAAPLVRDAPARARRRPARRSRNCSATRSCRRPSATPTSAPRSSSTSTARRTRAPKYGDRYSCSTRSRCERTCT